jgi:hypothetical protein
VICEIRKLALEVPLRSNFYVLNFESCSGNILLFQISGSSGGRGIEWKMFSEERNDGKNALGELCVVSRRMMHLI